MFKSILRNVLSNWIGMIINIIVSFFMIPFVIHEMGNSSYGFWVLLQSLTSYMFLLDFGVRSSLNRHLAKFYALGEYQESNKVINAGLTVYLSLCIGLIVWSCFLGMTFQSFFPIQDLDSTSVFLAVILVGSSVALHFPSAVFDAVLTGQQRYDLMNIAQILSLSVRTVLIVLALKCGYGIVAISLATFLASLLLFFLNYAFAGWISPGMQLDFSLPRLSMLKLLANHGLYAYILTGATRIITDAGNIVIGAFVSAEAVTFYAIAGSLTAYATSVVSGITTTIPPAASHLEARGDQKGLQSLCIAGTKFVLLIGLPILLTFILSGDTFLRLWVGEEFSASYPPLVLLSLGWAFNYLQSAAGCILIGLSRHKIAAGLVLVQAALNLGGSLFLVKSMGVLGVAWGALIASVVMNLVFQIHALRLLGISLGRFLAEGIVPVAIAVIPFVVVLEYLSSFFTPTNLATYFLQVALAVCSMLIILPWLVLSRDERDIVWSNLNRWMQLAGLSTP
jgi:O-antigen/teichoic acid export membrane protein